MNERLNQLHVEAARYAKEKYPSDIVEWSLCVSEKFAQLIVRECMTINKVETIALDLPEYNLGMLEGYRRARENMSIHFGVEE